jgi:hypothetical protein
VCSYDRDRRDVVVLTDRALEPLLVPLSLVVAILEPSLSPPCSPAAARAARAAAAPAAPPIDLAWPLPAPSLLRSASPRTLLYPCAPSPSPADHQLVNMVSPAHPDRARSTPRRGRQVVRCLQGVGSRLHGRSSQLSGRAHALVPAPAHSLFQRARAHASPLSGSASRCRAGSSAARWVRSPSAGRWCRRGQTLASGQDGATVVLQKPEGAVGRAVVPKRPD